MKIVINACFGGFSVSKKASKKLGMENEYAWISRLDPKLIEMVEKDSKSVSGLCAKLKVVEIPDNATDYNITEYDGAEGIVYVVDGKLNYI